MDSIEECPICGSGLQASETKYLQAVAINALGEVIHSAPTNLGADKEVYCENDHALAEILQAAKKDGLV